LQWRRIFITEIKIQMDTLEHLPSQQESIPLLWVSPAKNHGRTTGTDQNLVAVSADVKLTHPAKVKLTHLG
jgi:hypothetical protein